MQAVPGSTMSRPCPPGLTPADLEGFRSLQQLAYECAETIAATLDEGMTERQVADVMEAWLRERGVSSWFHRPFAWFGDRTAFRGFRSSAEFLPTKRVLTEHMPF